MIDVALHFMIYISRILHIAFSSSADPLFGQLAYHNKRYYCKKPPSLPVCLLLNKVMFMLRLQKLEGVDLTTTKLLFEKGKLPIGICQYFCPKPQVDVNSRHIHLTKKSNDAQLHKSFTHCYSLLFCFGKAPQITVQCLKPQRAFDIQFRATFCF